MREYLTTSNIGWMCGGYTAQQVRNWWDSGELVGVAELLNPGGKQLRFKKTPELGAWCAQKALNARRRERPINYRRWWQLVKEEGELRKKLGGYAPWWNWEEMQELMRQRPARMNFDEYLKLAGITQMKAMIARPELADSRRTSGRVWFTSRRMYFVPRDEVLRGERDDLA